jgi:hypothetical protein
VPTTQSPINLPYYELMLTSPDPNVSPQQALVTFVALDAPVIDLTLQDAAALQVAAALKARDDVSTVSVTRIDTTSRAL